MVDQIVQERREAALKAERDRATAALHAARVAYNRVEQEFKAAVGVGLVPRVEAADGGLDYDACPAVDELDNAERALIRAGNYLCAIGGPAVRVRTRNRMYQWYSVQANTKKQAWLRRHEHSLTLTSDVAVLDMVHPDDRHILRLLGEST